MKAIDTQKEVLHQPADLLLGERFLNSEESFHLVIHVLHYDKYSISFSIPTNLLYLDDVLVGNGLQYRYFP